MTQGKISAKQWNVLVGRLKNGKIAVYGNEMRKSVIFMGLICVKKLYYLYDDY